MTAGVVISAIVTVLPAGSHTATPTHATFNSKPPDLKIRNRAWLAQAQLLNTVPLKTGTYQRGLNHLRLSGEAEPQCLQAAVNQEELNETLEQIDQEAEAALKRLSQAIAQQLTQERARINALLQDSSTLEAAIQSGQLSDELQTLLEQFRKNPDSVETYLTQEANKETERLELEISRRQSDAKTELRKAAKAQLEGAWLIAPKTSDSIFHPLQGSRLIVLPQKGERLLLGEPENLAPYTLVQDASSDTTAFMPCPQY